MTLLSGFADEIAADLDGQIGALKALDIEYIELRSVWNTNILDLKVRQITQVKRALHKAGITVSSIGSPIGKTPLDEPFDRQMRRFQHALDLADTFGAEYIRLFSFYPPDYNTASPANAKVDWEQHRGEVISRLRAMTQRARETNVVLLHENERNIYGDTIARCVDLLGSVDDPQFRAVFDPANFIATGESPYPDAYETLRPWIAYIHVKDAKLDGTVTAAGEGISRWPDLLRRLAADGYDGFFSLEPHLASAGRFKGFSGPDLFSYAVGRFRGLVASTT
ncbi:MAG: sugar phosphate isomerase/epimerase [Gemmatimonadaceae bacterium]